ncbi:hypothetical protein QTG54_017028 [Skeletonema marinoi]|uniref:Uncharacterized protein n=1 Tax=Skeletonema marinoi TaxID=267567 RepID=A0AAD8XRJ0_9STRA|nr:hypothetical protein QTG54_017028 [Skeletonema marinoi]
MNTTKLQVEERKKIDSKDDDDFPFVLCTPTKNDNDEIDAQDTIFEEDKSPRLMNFFLKPRPRRSRQCPTGWHQEQIGMRTDSALKDMAKDSTNEHIMERNPSQQQQFTPISSVPITPPVVINLLKRRRRPSQDEHQEEKDEGDDNSPSKKWPLFPSLGRQPMQQQQQDHPVLRRPVARRLR